MREAFEGACDRQKKTPVTMPDVGVDGKVTIVNHNPPPSGWPPKEKPKNVFWGPQELSSRMSWLHKTTSD